MSTARRRGLLVAAGAAALLGGATLSWKRLQPQDADQGALAELWQREVNTPSGARLPLVSLRGRPLVINFWATWCPPCVKEMPELDRFAREHAARGWQVLGLAVDQADAVQDFLRQTPVGFPIGILGSDGLAWVRVLGNPTAALPFTLVMDAQGRVLERKLGATTAEALSRWALPS